MWKPPSLTLVWPSFFRSDATEETQMVNTAALALKANMITRRMALEKVRSVYPFENIEAVLEQLDEEAEESAEHQVERMLSKAMSGETDADEGNDGRGKGEGEEEDKAEDSSR